MIVEAKRSPAQYRLRRLIGNIGFGFSVDAVAILQE
jgi:hypothetical protein